MDKPLTKKIPRLTSVEIITIISLFLVIGTVVAVMIFLYVKNHHNEYDEGGGHKIIKVINTSSHPSTVSAGGKFLLYPGETKEVNIAQHDTVSTTTLFYDGTSFKNGKQISNPHIHTLYITDSGLRTNISGSEYVRFVNITDYPITFVERGRGGRRWEKCTLPAYGMSENHFVGKNTTWEAVQPMDGLENYPIAEITVSGIPKQLIFDGNTLRAI